MRGRRSIPLIFSIVLSCTGAGIAPAIALTSHERAELQQDYIGEWNGTWALGATGGNFDLTFEKGKDGALGGTVAVSGEPTYKTPFRSVTFAGSKMTAKYDFPPDASIEVTLAGTFEKGAATGTWSAATKAGGGEVASGTWKVSKK